MKGRSLRSLSILGILEGISLLLLLFVAVPVKYFMPHGEILVKIIGPMHGGIFLLYIFVAIVAVLEYKWGVVKFLLVVAASVIPFGFLYVEYKMIRPQQKLLASSSEPSAANQKMYLWLKRIGVGGFLFFLIKGLFWVAIFTGLIKGCN